MFEEIIKRLYKINAPCGANTGTPVAGEFALYDAEVYAEQGGADKKHAVGVAMLRFIPLAKNDNEATKKFAEILEQELKKCKDDNWEIANTFKALRGIWLTEALIVKNEQEGI